MNHSSSSSLCSPRWLFAACLAAGGWLSALQAAPVVLINGRDFEGWRQPTAEWITARAVALSAADPAKFTVEPGRDIMVNGRNGRSVNLVSEAVFGDVEAHVEFCLARHSNSGVYLMGRYEVQIYDSHGVAKDKYPGIECGGIYPRWTDARGEFEGHSPRVNASQPPGEWQSFDVVFRAPRFNAAGNKTENARFVKVLHNGQVVHENVQVTGPTRAAMYADEQAAGPMMLQGDHGPIAYRNFRVTPVQLP